MLTTKDKKPDLKELYFNNILIGDLVVNDDGFWVLFFSNERKGYFESYALRLIADKMEEMNKPWQDNINEYFSRIKNFSDHIE